MDDDKISMLEGIVKEATEAAQESERKYEEVGFSRNGDVVQLRQSTICHSQNKGNGQQHSHLGNCTYF